MSYAPNRSERPLDRWQQRPRLVASRLLAPVNRTGSRTVDPVAPTKTNPYARDARTPLIAGLLGGADAYGLAAQDKPLEAVFGDVDRARLVNNNTPNDALVAVYRMDVGPLGLSNDYAGYDVIAVVNLTDVHLGSPSLFVGGAGGALRTGGLGVNPLFGRAAGSFDGVDGYYAPLTTLGPRAVWITLVPEAGAAVRVRASVGGFEVERDLRQGTGSVAYIRAIRPELTVEPELTGLASIVTSGDGRHIYAVDPTRDALVVVNTDDLTQRQLFKDGFEGVTGLARAEVVAIDATGTTVYVGSPGDDVISVFGRDPVTGNLTPLPQFSIGALGFDTDAIEISADGTRLITTGFDGTINAFDRDTTTGALAFLGGAFVGPVNDVALSDAVSAGYAISRDADRLTVFNSETLAVGQILDGAENGLDGASAVAVSADGRFVYVTGAADNTIATFEREPATGQLAVQQILTNGSDGVRGVLDPSAITVTPDQRFVLVVGEASDTVAVFLRSEDGRLQFVQVVRNNVDGVSNMVAPATIATDATGAKVYVGALGGTFAGGLVAFDNIMLGVVVPPPVSVITEFEAIESLVVSTASGDDVIALRRAPREEVTALAIETNGGEDRVVLSDSSRMTNVETGGDSDQIIVQNPRAAARTAVQGGDGDDVISILEVGGGSAQVEVFAGTGRDRVRVTGQSLRPTASGLPRVVLHGESPSVVPGDIFEFDPGNPGPTPNYSPAPPSPNAGTVALFGRGEISYDTFEGVVVVDAPLLRIRRAVGAEGGVLVISVEVTPNGVAGVLDGPIEWDLDGDGRYGDALGASVTLTWEQLRDLGIDDDGVYPIGVRATNVDGFTGQDFRTVEIVNVGPSLAVTGAASVPVTVDHLIAFAGTDPGNDRITDWIVDWGDGTVEQFGSAATSATHVYERPGVVAVTVTAIDEDGVWLANPVLVDVFLSADQVSAGGRYVFDEGEGVELVADAGGAAISYLWDLNGDDSFDDAFGAITQVTWDQLVALGIDDSGSYATEVQITYEGGGVVYSAGVLDIQNVAPSATLVGSGPFFEGGTGATVTFIDQYDIAPGDRRAGYTYWFDFDDDGSYEIQESISPTAIVPDSLLLRDGVLRVRGVIFDQDVGFTGYTTDIVVLPQVAILDANGPDATAEGDLYTLTWGVVGLGAEIIDSWTIDWGDGTIQSVPGGLRTTTHRFVDDGTFAITISGTDGDGVLTDVVPVAVANVAPTLSGLAPVAGVEGDQIVVAGQISDPGPADSFTLTIDWGDGTASEQFELPAGATRFDAVHRYDDDGVSTVTFTVVDDDGGIVAGALTAIVANADPVVTGIRSGRSGRRRR